MTEPLIARKDLVGVAFRVMSDSGGDMTAGMMADAVLAYLRTVLTPEALRIYGTDSWQNGRFLHRRIFGERQ